LVKVRYSISKVSNTGTSVLQSSWRAGGLNAPSKPLVAWRDRDIHVACKHQPTCQFFQQELADFAEWVRYCDRVQARRGKTGSFHAGTPMQSELWLAKEIQAKGWSLKIQVYWLPKNASWLAQIEIWFSILQRKLLKPNDFESLEALEKAIRSFIRYCNRTAKPIHWTYTVEKLEQKLSAH
jgi:transposase